MYARAKNCSEALGWHAHRARGFTGETPRATSNEDKQMGFATILILAVSLLLLIYLTFALLRPEKF